MAQAAAAAGDALKRKGRASLYRIGAIVVGLLVLLVAVNIATHGDFLAPGNLLNVLRQIAVNAILATGQTFVIITAGIDLSVGSLVALTGVLMAGTLGGVHTAWVAFIVAIIVGIGAGGVAGAINGTPVVKFGLPPFITTLAMMLMARGLAFMYTNGAPIEIDNNAFDDLGTGLLFPTLGRLVHIPGIPVPVVIMLATVIVASYVLGQTRFGRYVYAIGGNEEAARLAGVSVGTVKTMVYVLCGALAAVGGFLLMALFSSGSPQTGVGFELNAIAAVVVGGTSLMGGRGTIVGTFFGALLIGVLNNVMNLIGIESYTQQIVLGAVIVIAVIVDELRKRYLAHR